MDGQGEVGDEFGAGDDEEQKYHTVVWQYLVSKCLPFSLFVVLVGETHVSKLFNIHTNPKIHPMVVSLLNASQFSTRSSENAVPYTSVVNRMSPVAVT